MVNLFDTPAAAEGYAKARPPLHARIVERIASRAATVLDVGCGAGLSTAPLLKISSRVIGVDPFPEMLKWGARIAPGAHFATARAESLPFRDAAFDLIAAAGSLNYTEPAQSFPELRRVLQPGGTLAVYDFTLPDFPYERPADGGIKLSPSILGEVAVGFHVARVETLEMPVTMSHAEYVAFLKTEVDVPDPVWQPEWRLVFRGYIAWLK